MGTVISRVVRVAGRTVVRLGVVLSLLVLVAMVGQFSGRYRMVTVLTGSMRPSVPAGSLAIAIPERVDQVRVGQIITFHAPIGDHWVVTHRVIAVVSGGAHPRVRTQGDANAGADPWVAQLDNGPVWKVRAVLPGVGSAVRALRSPVVHVATVLLAPALLALLTVAGIWQPRPARGQRRALPSVHART